ncbi:FAD:protein FMN transferase [Leifsonia virtsii]|uniref:FAD:protein FMN transferase n=1 Tax=Leifsonia virtsii TaxID=3035915 RepID=A0ABT8J1P9_9MICO|nr:FAD:protein FMN transferase [Leifsonia virtsii]MDN4599010.1 FAD:protein FMN transferase [Leifsonia virtsii]
MAHPLAPELTSARSDWRVWSTDASVVVERGDVIDAARAIADDVLAAVGAACDRFDPASELSRLADERAARGVEVSPLLADLVATALRVAERTGGSVDPTLGRELARWGYDRDLEELDATAATSDTGRPATFTVSVTRRSPGWRAVRLDGRTLTLPASLRLDLGATAKAYAADLVAARIASGLDTGVLVSLGGDIATAGTTSAGGWEVLVQDAPADPSQQVFLPDGSAIATSSTQKRRWRHEGRVHQHILDPASGAPVVPAWRSATVATADCVEANALSTAAIVRGRGAPRWLAEQRAAARLVDLQGRVVATGAWPAPDALPSGGAR